MDDVTFALVQDQVLTRDQVGKLASRLGIVDSTGKANPTSDQRMQLQTSASNLILAMAVGKSENSLQSLLVAIREYLTPTPYPPAPAPTAIAGGDPTATPLPPVEPTPPPIG